MLEGLLLDSGDGVTHCIPVVDSMIMEYQIMRINLAGRHVTEYLGKLLMMRGYALNSSADFEVVREIKEKYCFVSANIK
jgi:actin-related protein 2